MPATFIYSIVTDPLIIFILAVVFGITGLIYVLIYKSKLDADRKSKNWPSVPGKVTYSRVEKRNTSRGSDSERRGGVRYVPEVKYSYAVAGSEYQGNRIGNGIYVSMLAPAGPQNLLKRFPTGASVPVYYDPTNPGEAVLEPTSFSNGIGFMLGIGLTLLGSLFVALWIYRLAAGH